MPFKLLFSPLSVGPLRLPNRLVMPPMTTNLAGGDGAVNDDLVEFYATRARGGVGLIIVELTIVSVEGKRLPHNIGVWSDDQVAGLTRLAGAIKEAGAKAVLQIGHGGRESNSEYSGRQPVAPSDVPSLFRGTTTAVERPVQLDRDGINRLELDFIRAAARAKAAGFEAVELHGCHGYLIAQFLSPYANKRSDAYGGGLENRARFLTEIIEGIKTECGSGFGVIARINGHDYVPDGNTEIEAAGIAGLAEKAGADAIHVSAGFHQSRPYRILPGMEAAEACHTPLAAAVKARVGLPVIAVGRIGRLELAEEILAQGRADLIAMGRALICDPDLPRKARQGRLEDIRRCVWCNQGCIGEVHRLRSVTCLQNPIAGRERRLKLIPAAAPQRVLVVGGGPAGLACAAVSAAIGHRVTLIEQDDELGGQLRLALLPPTRGSLKTAIDNLVREVNKAGVEVITGRRADLKLIEDVAPDRTILALGSRPIKPDIKGLEAVAAAHPAQALLEPDRLGPTVAVIGGGLVGAEVADFLSAQGRRVALLEMLPHILSEAVTSTRVYLIDQLNRQGVRVICGAEVKALEPGRVVYVQDGWRCALEGVESVVLAVGSAPMEDLAQELTRAGRGFERIGDCLSPKDAMAAIHQGYAAALARPLGAGAR